MNDIPVLHVRGKGIAQGYEKAIYYVFKDGCEIATQYDKPGDPLSKDCTLNLVIEDPESDPMIHKAFPGGIEDLREYVMELHGEKDEWVKNHNDPNDTRWEYTYHGRFVKYGAWKEYNDWEGYYTGNGYDYKPINQVEYVIDKLSKQPYTRQAQMITWMPSLDLTCYDPPCFVAGTKITTPKGLRNIEDIKDGELVYAYDIKNNKIVESLVCNSFKKKSETYKLSFIDENIEVSSQQLLFINNEWVEARYAKVGDKIKLSTHISDVSDMMIVGYMHGDGWLSSGYNKSTNRTYEIKRHDVCFSIHKDADDTWIKNYLNTHTHNVVRTEVRYIKSNVVKNGGTSKKIRSSSKELYEKLFLLGCPQGKKPGQKISNNLFGLSNKQIKDFLTGIYSAEGCIYFGGKKNRCSIQIGMNWKECVEFISLLLDKFDIKYTRFINKKTYSIRIDNFYEIEKCINMFDFRLDSRKQAKYLKLKNIVVRSKKDLDDKVNLIKLIRKEKLTYTIKDLKVKYPSFNTRWLNENYIPSIRWKKSNDVIDNTFILTEITNKIITSPHNTVYDFEVSHPDHAIIANGIISHNCLQSIWLRALVGTDEVWTLNTNIRIRSNDGWGASFMNMFGLMRFVRTIGDQISQRVNHPVVLGRLNWQADSYHIYGKDIKDVKGRLIDKIDANQPFEKRVMNFNSDLVQEMYHECENAIREKIKRTEEGFGK